jgi:RND family efflux transporter MFP subunit
VLAAMGSLVSIAVVTYLVFSTGAHNVSAADASVVAQTVETIHPTRVDIAHSFNTNGTLEAFETADLYPKVSGYLADVRVDIGDRVKAGQVLAVISLPETEKELAEAEATVAAKRADLALQRITLQRQEGLLKIQGTSQQAYDEAKGKAAVAAAEVDLAAATVEKIRTMLNYRQVLAPFDGDVSHRQVNRGDFVQAATAGRTTPLFTVQRVDMIRVFCNVPESDVARLRVGISASVKPYGQETTPIVGKVTRFEGRLDPETRNMRTEIDIPNPVGTLYPGMYVQVSLETENHSNALTLPASAVGSDTKGKFVYVMQQGRIERQPIQIGMTEGGMVEVLSGLADGADVAMVIQSAPLPGTSVRGVSHGKL